MAKRETKQPAMSKTTIYGCALALVCGVAYYLNTGSPTASAAKKPPAKQTKTTTDSLFTDADYSASFEPSTAPLKNVFRPLIAGGNQPFVGVDPKTGIPTYLTGGENDWAFTGTAADGQVTMALVENKTRADSVFLTVGQNWKTSTVAGIEGDHLLLKGPDGVVKSILMEADAQDLIAQAQANRTATSPPVASAQGGSVPGGVAPITPPLSGPIGGAGTADAASLDPNNLSVQPDNPRPRRNRRRGNGGGGN